MNPSSSRTTRWLKWAVPALVVAALGWGVVRALDKRETQQAEARAAAQALQTTPDYRIAERDLVTVRVLALQQTATVSGSIEAVQTASVKARTAGEVQGLSKREGDAVQAGEVLARIDDTEARALHLGIAMFLGYLAYPITKSSPRDRMPLYDWLLASAVT